MFPFLKGFPYSGYLAKEVNKEKLTVPLEYDVPLAPATKDVNDIEVTMIYQGCQRYM